MAGLQVEKFAHHITLTPTLHPLLSGLEVEHARKLVPFLIYPPRLSSCYSPGADGSIGTTFSSRRTTTARFSPRCPSPCARSTPSATTGPAWVRPPDQPSFLSHPARDVPANSLATLHNHLVTKPDARTAVFVNCTSDLGSVRLPSFVLLLSPSPRGSRNTHLLLLLTLLLNIPCTCCAVLVAEGKRPISPRGRLTLFDGAWSRAGCATSACSSSRCPCLFVLKLRSFVLVHARPWSRRGAHAWSSLHLLSARPAEKHERHSGKPCVERDQREQADEAQSTRPADDGGDTGWREFED